jgi:hypothetical protein
VRVTAYQGAMMSSHLPLARTMAASREGKDSAERSLIEVRISAMLETVEEAEFIVDMDEVLTDQAYMDKVRMRIKEIEIRHGPGKAVQLGEPLDVFALSAAIREFLDEENPADWGGAISDLLDTLEGMLGISTAGCMDDEVEPVLPRIMEVLAVMRRDPKLLKLRSGERSFFCHPVG